MEEKKKTVGQLILRNGALGGILALYLAAVGLVEAFSGRFLIGNLISLGQIFLVAGAITAGVLSAFALKDQSQSTKWFASLLAGAISSLPLAFIVFIIEILVIRPTGFEDIFVFRDMFVSFSPNLFDILTFKQGLWVGTLLRILASALLGLLGTGFLMIPPRLRNALISGIVWTLGIGLFSENVSQIIEQTFGRGLIKFLFQNKALNPLAAVIIFAATFAFSYFNVRHKSATRWNNLPPNAKRTGRLVFIALGILLLILLPWIVGLFLSQALFIIGLYVMMGLGLNIVVGYAGLLDLGYVAFFAFGAYTMGILTSTGPLGRGDLNFWTALPFATFAGVLWGLLLGFPVLRLRGDYLAIVTLGFGEIIRILATSNWLAPLEGGPQGVLFIPSPSFFGIPLNSPQTMYYLVIGGSLLAVFISIRLRDSRLGRQWMAMREDEDVAEAMGINLVQTKLLAFAIGAAFSAMAGAIFASRLGNIFPHSFNLLISINALALIIVGGIGSIPGVIVGAAILAGLPELLREFSEYRLLFYGILLMIMMLFKPEGFLPEPTRKRELHAGDQENLNTNPGPPELADS